MLFKIRKFISGAVTACFLLSLSGCDAITSQSSAIPPVAVTDVTTPAQRSDAPPLYCKVGHGSALFGRDWYDFMDVEFELYQGQPADVSLTRMHGGEQMVIRALFDGSGQKLIFCPVPGAGAALPDQRISCTSLYALDDDLRDGIKRTFDIPAAVRGGAITCAYEQERLRSLRLPPAGN